MLAKQLQGAAKSAVAQYIEDTFSTYLYTGNGSTQTITNGIDLSGKGGFVWLKRRDAVDSHALYDTVRGVNKQLVSNTTAAESTTDRLPAFNSTGFNVASGMNTNAATYASWTFRKQAKFFDVVTYTGDGSNPRAIPHSLGSVPGFIILKCSSTSATDWFCYHRSLSNTQSLNLNQTTAVESGTTIWGSTTPTSTNFTVGNVNSNTSGRTYVAYLFAHDAGGFGAAGTDNVISCGSFTTDGSGNATVTLGYEPQWVMTKRTDSTGVWSMFDVMRGMPLSGSNQLIEAQSSAAETAGGQSLKPTATGFIVTGSNASATFIYIAIRRGPMRTPTSGTSVFEPVAYTGNNTTQRQIGSTVLLDALLLSCRTANSTSWTTYAQFMGDRLRGANVMLATSRTDAETGSWATYFNYDTNVGWDTGSATQGYNNATGSTFVSYAFRRAPGFFDVVCYTGTGSATTITHNLASVPELMIVKTRSTADFWYVYHKDVGNTKYLQLQSTAAPATSSVVWNNTTPTSSVFSAGVATNGSGVTHVAYLFATVAGVSKVGSYTGNGSNQTINCGFTAGARFIMIKRTDSTGDWYVWDTARGIVSGNDPRLSLNSTAAEVTTDDTIDPDNSGFIVNQVAATNVNVSSATYIFLAIA
jgi:hypothetical protein